MSFAAPLFLLALLIVPAVAVLYVLGHRRRRRAAEAFVRPHMRASVVRWAPGWRRHLPIALFIAASAVLIVAVARPQATVAVPVERANVLLVTDESSSMQATDVSPTRLEAAKSAAERFLDDVPGRVNVGAIGFSTYSRLLAAPTRERKVVREALETLRARGSTATGDALDLAITTLRRAPRPGERRPPAAIVLLSDGRPTRGRDVAGVAARAKRLKIPIFTVSLGTSQGTVRLRGRIVHVPPDDAGLARIARVSGGQAFSAGDAGELRRVYDGLASRVSTRDTEREMVYLVALALLIVLAGATTSMRWFHARPEPARVRRRADGGGEDRGHDEAAVGTRLEQQLAAVGVDDRPCDGQAEPGAAAVGVASQAIERGGQAPQLLTEIVGPVFSTRSVGRPSATDVRACTTPAERL